MGSGWLLGISSFACLAASSFWILGQFCANTARARTHTLLPWLGPFVLKRSALIGVAQEPSDLQSLAPGWFSSSPVP